jgi:hypothetical protein
MSHNPIRAVVDKVKDAMHKDDSSSTSHHSTSSTDRATSKHSEHAHHDLAHPHTTVATTAQRIPRHEKTTWAKCKHPADHHPHPVTHSSSTKSKIPRHEKTTWAKCKYPGEHHPHKAHTTSTKSKIPRHEKTTWAKCKNPKEHHPHHAHGEHKSIPRHEKTTWAKCKHPQQHHIPQTGTVVERIINKPVIVEHHHQHVTEVVHPSVERQHETVEVQQVVQPVYEKVSGKHQETYGGKTIKVAERYESDADARAQMERNREHLASQANVTHSESYDKRIDHTKHHDVAVGHKVIQEVTPVVHRDVAHEKVVHKDEKLIEKIHHAPSVNLLHQQNAKPTDAPTH